MNKRDRRAILGSIAKWIILWRKQNAMPTDSSTCPLCWIVNDECESCMVYRKVGATDCHRTPFYSARDAILDAHFGDSAVRFARPKITEEINFLLSLLPGEHKPLKGDEIRRMYDEALVVYEKAEAELKL